MKTKSNLMQHKSLMTIKLGSKKRHMNTVFTYSSQEIPKN